MLLIEDKRRRERGTLHTCFNSQCCFRTYDIIQLPIFSSLPFEIKVTVRMIFVETELQVAAQARNCDDPDADEIMTIINTVHGERRLVSNIKTMRNVTAAACSLNEWTNDTESELYLLTSNNSKEKETSWNFRDRKSVV